MITSVVMDAQGRALHQDSLERRVNAFSNFGFKGYDEDFVRGRQGSLLPPEALGISPVSKRIPTSKRVYVDPVFFPLQGSENHPDTYSRFNRPFYSKGQSSISGNFSTSVSYDSLMAQADAREFVTFVDRSWRRDDSISVVEFGVGNGNYAFDFMDEVRSISPEIYDRLVYWAVDGSHRMLVDLSRHHRTRSHEGKFQYILDDVAVTPFPPLIAKRSDVALIRHNEFYDDLPAQEIVVTDGKLFEMWLRLFLSEDAHGVVGGNFLDAILKTPKTREQLEEIARTFEDALGDRDFPFQHLYGEVAYMEIDQSRYPHAHLLNGNGQSTMMFNFAAYHHFKRCLELLSATGGYIRFNDYLLHEGDDTRDNTLRTILSTFRWRQITGPTNVTHLRQLARESGFGFILEDQSEHISRQKGELYVEPRALYSQDFIDYLTRRISENGEDVDRDGMKERLRTFADNYFARPWVKLSEAIPIPPDNIMRIYFSAEADGSPLGKYSAMERWRIYEKPPSFYDRRDNGHGVRGHCGGPGSSLRIMAEMERDKGRWARRDTFQIFAKLGTNYVNIVQGYFKDRANIDLSQGYRTALVHPLSRNN